MLYKRRPLVLVHGLWNDSRLFTQLIKLLDQTGIPILAPSLPHRFGRRSLIPLADQLGVYIHEAFGPDTSIDLLGFSMGGLICRIWLQKLGGAHRTNRFISVGTPHQGTFTAQLMPPWLLPGVAEMKRASFLIKDLNSDLSSFKDITCISYFCFWDLMVLPGWRAVLPVGSRYAMPVLTHRQLISNSKALNILANALTR